METIKARTDFDSTLFGEGSTISAAISDLAEKIEARVRAIDTSSSFEALDLLIENLHGRGVWRRSRLQGMATPAQLAALVEGQRTFERLASERAVQIPRSGQFRQGPFMGMRQILKLVCSSIGGTLERLGCEPGPVNEDLDFE